MQNKNQADNILEVYLGYIKIQKSRKSSLFVLSLSFNTFNLQNFAFKFCRVPKDIFVVENIVMRS